MTIASTSIPSPVGALRLAADDDGLQSVAFSTGDAAGRPSPNQTDEDPDHPVLREAASQIAAYFAGTLTVFRLPLAFQGTAFQMKVWIALTRIPFGALQSYGQVARDIGQPGAMRAVGAAANRNPIAIVVPCHRVIGAGGALTGFGGGLDAKMRLLELEGSSFAPGTTFTSRAGGRRKSTADTMPRLF